MTNSGTVKAPSRFLVHDVVFRSFGDQWQGTPIGCGFLPKREEIYRDLVCDDFALIYVIRGQGGFTDRYGRDFRLNPGDAFHRQPGMSHSSRVESDCGYVELFIRLDRKFYQALTAMGVWCDDIPVWRCGLNRSWIEKVWRFKNLLRSEAALDGSRALLLAFELILELRTLAGVGPAMLPPDPRIDQAIRILRDEHGWRLPIASVAKKVGMSKERFRKVFRDMIGISPGQYGIRCRIDRARALLSDGTLTVSEVASQLGYPDIFSFAKQFKQITGLSPGKYRI